MQRYDMSFDDMMAEGADFFSLFGDYMSSMGEEDTLFGLSDEDIAEIFEE